MSHDWSAPIARAAYWCHFKLSVRCNLCEAMASHDSFDTSSSEDTSRNSSPEKINPRPIRNKKLPARLRRLQEEHDEIFTFEELELDQSRFNT